MRETSVCPISTSIISATGSSSRVALPAQSVRIHCTGDTFIKFGDSNVVATTADCPLSLLEPEYFNTENTGYTHIAAITATGSSTVSVSGCK
jgi:hypothetical protein